jgi:hypothetical protein
VQRLTLVILLAMLAVCAVWFASEGGEAPKAVEAAPLVGAPASTASGPALNAPTFRELITPPMLAAAVTLLMTVIIVNSGVIASLNPLATDGRVRWMTTLPLLIWGALSVADWILSGAASRSEPLLGPLSIQGLLASMASTKGHGAAIVGIVLLSVIAIAMWVSARNALANALARNPETADLSGTLVADYAELAAWPARITEERVVDRLPPMARPPIFDLAAHIETAAKRQRDRRGG